MESSLASQLQKLTLFKPVAEKVNVITTERPVTPIYEEIVAPAATLEDLHNLLKRRLLITRTWALSFLSAAEQEDLAAILFSEVTRIWPDLQSCGRIALLNDEQNESMLRRMTIYVVTTCEILFDRHIALFQNLLKTDVFEKFANFVRVKKLLSDEAARLLDVLTVRRYIGDDIRAMDSGQIEESFETVTKEDMSFGHLVTLSRPPLDIKYKWNLESDIRLMKSKFPNLDLAALRKVLSTLPPLPPIEMFDRHSESKAANDFDSGIKTVRTSTAELLTAASRQIDRASNNATPKRKYSVTDPLKYYEPEFSNEKTGDTFITEPVELTREERREIIRSTKKLKASDDSDMAIQPLLKASLYLEGVAKRTYEKEARIAELAKFLTQLEKNRQLDVKRSPYLQPDYFEVPISKEVLLRASGPRVTERQLEAAMSLQPFMPLFDEMTFDITEDDIAKMDESLFVHRELADVYKEIVAVIPKDYMELSSDKTIQAAAVPGTFDIARCIASSRIQRSTGGGSATISKLPTSGALPVSLKEPPWAKEGFKTWAKSGPNKALCTTNRPRLTAARPASADIAREISEHLPDFMDPKLFMSWHSWWRQFFSSDDYYKYVHRQDTDFLTYIFHLWDEDGGRQGSATGLSSGGGSASLSMSATTTPSGRRKESAMELTSASSGHHSMEQTPGPGMFLVDTTIKEKLETEAKLDDKAAKAAQAAKEKARLYSVTGLTQTISIGDLATQRIEHRREEELARRKLSPDEILDKELSLLSLQERFVRVWDLLRLDGDYRAKMVFKYAGSESSHLLHVVKLWECATHAILKREYALGQFEKFERIASDPNRYFEKGYLGTTQARLDEEVVRASLSKKLDEHDNDVKVELAKLMVGTGDAAMFRDRSYAEKMLGDRVQVLFWLSEERKAEAIRRHLADKKLSDALLHSTLVGQMPIVDSPRWSPTPPPLPATPPTPKQHHRQSNNPPPEPLLTLGDVLAVMSDQL